MALRPRSPATQLGKTADAAWEAVISVGVGMLLGYYADRFLGTEPILFFVFLGVGCYTGFRRLMRLARESAQQVSDAPPPPAGPGESEDAPRGPSNGLEP